MSVELDRERSAENKMIVVLAHHWDSEARMLVERWARYGASLMTPADLSSSGWSYRVPDLGATKMVVSQETICSADVVGVYTRIPAIVGSDVYHIALEDRAYVVAEMNAFLLALLTSINCRVINRPTANTLSGPNWRQEQWLALASKLGIPVAPVCHGVQYDVASSSPRQEDILSFRESITLTLLDGRSFTSADQVLTRRAYSLAQAAHVDLLSVTFARSDDEFILLNADPWPVLTEEIVEAMPPYFFEWSSLLEQAGTA